MDNKFDVRFIVNYAGLMKKDQEVIPAMTGIIHANYEEYIHKPTNTSFKHSGIRMIPHYTPLQYALEFTTFLDKVGVPKEDFIQKVKECKEKLQAIYSKPIAVNMIECDQETVSLN